MLLTTLWFSGQVDYGDYCPFCVAITSPAIKSAVSFFGYADAFQDFGSRLASFPSDTQAEVCFQQGEAGNSGPEYLLLKAYYLDSMGHTALRLEIDNKASAPAELQAAFSLAADVASLIELGRQLMSWQFQQGPESSIEWHPTVS